MPLEKIKNIRGVIMNRITELVMGQLNGNDFEKFELLKEIIKELQNVKKELSDSAKKIEAENAAILKTQKAEQKAKDNEVAKEVVESSFKVGDSISWKLSSGKVFEGTIAKFNEKTIRVIRKDSDGYKPSADGNCYANVGYGSVVLEVAEEVA